MGSAGNSNQYPWPPYESFQDCSQGICSMYCPQWCYMIFAPPPPFDFGESSEKGPGINLSPLIIALIGIGASVCILVTYYVVISKFCRRRTNASARDIDREANSNSSEPWQGNNTGMEESLIKSISVHKYKKNDGVVEGTDCSVCLSEFQENESLRLLPKCSHAFHVSCIDAWLKSHSSCPLCRSNIAAPTAVATVPRSPPRPHNQQQQVSPSAEDNTTSTQQERVNQNQHTNNGSVLVVQERQDESFRVHDHEIQGLRRSVSLIEVLSSSQSDDADEEEDLEKQMEHNLRLYMDRRERLSMQNFEVSMETGSSKEGVSGEHSSKLNNIRNGVVSMVKGPLGLKRSVSTGRFGVTRNAKESSSVIPS